MYESYYRLDAKPFTLLPDPGYLFLGTRHKLALNLLEYGLTNGAAFIVITGGPGTGKTTLLNRVLEQSRHQWTIGVLSNTHGGLGGLMPWITASFGLETKGKSEVELFHEFGRFLEGEQAAGRRVLLVLDEAQNIGATMLEELRLLSNLNDGRRRSLQILLSGQPALRELLEGPAMEQVAQRISVDYALEPLAEEEAVSYIGHRVRVAGGQRPLFSTLACRKVHALTGGVPRLINQLCDHALVYGYAAQVEMITAQIVLDAARVRDRNGLLPFRAVPDEIAPSRSDLDVEAAEVAENAAAVRDAPASSTKTEPAAETDPERLYRQALALKQAGDCSRAIALFDRLTADMVWGVKALAQKGLCLNEIGRSQDAVRQFERLLGSGRGTASEQLNVRYLLARTLESLCQPQAARDHYCAIHAEEPGFRDVEARLRRLPPAWSLVSFRSPEAIKDLAKHYSQRLRACF
ncbi:AAA family ATPase [Nitrospira sp. NS4]|uniref:AAA family ATPase n=1 Tax=Nitrospira sp. NS4 TaxID=3414498 RepID=UPI003C2EB054